MVSQSEHLTMAETLAREDAGKHAETIRALVDLAREMRLQGAPRPWPTPELTPVPRRRNRWTPEARAAERERAKAWATANAGKPGGARADTRKASVGRVTVDPADLQEGGKYGGF